MAWLNEEVAALPGEYAELTQITGGDMVRTRHVMASWASLPVTCNHRNRKLHRPGQARMIQTRGRRRAA